MPMANQPARLRASDVLDWDHLTKIADNTIENANRLADALAVFAYNFTSIGDEDSRDQMLIDLLQDATAGQSTDTAEKIIKAAALGFKADLEALRRFAKENGIRLKRD
jgi:hypothetical protein